jgi:prolyl-tRNA synthetase
MSNKGITPRNEDYSQWYLDIIDRAELAENSPVRGAMVIKPYGYAIWEKIREQLDQRINERGCKNAYFPLFIPKSFLSKEADHVKGFAKECAIVTHYRLKEKEDGTGVEVDPEAKLDEELIVRPTSETIMYDTFSRWITSWRDLPLKINQWVNIVRWERRTRPFLRTSEFLWQEGHTVHETEEQSLEEVLGALEMYKKFAREVLALETLTGIKSESEKFAGANDTYGVEAMMQDGKSLQFGTSHNLGQNFAKAFNIQFTNRDGELEYPWQTSWGVSTRMMGALIMSHSDDKGLVLPPKVAPIKVVIIPIYSDDNKDEVIKYSREVYNDIKEVTEDIEFDDRDFVSAGYKFNEWEKKGVPIRIEIGPRDLENNQCVIVRRDTLEKNKLPVSNVREYVQNLLDEIQNNILKRSEELLISNTHSVNSYEEFKDVISNKRGFVHAHWCGNPDCEEGIKVDTKATTRCQTEEGSKNTGPCIYCGEHGEEWVFGISY